MAAKDYEGTAAAAVSNFQRYYYFNPLSPRQGAASVAKIFSIVVISIAKAPFLASYDPSRCVRERGKKEGNRASLESSNQRYKIGIGRKANYSATAAAPVDSSLTVHVRYCNSHGSTSIIISISIDPLHYSIVYFDVFTLFRFSKADFRFILLCEKIIEKSYRNLSLAIKPAYRAHIKISSSTSVSASETMVVAQIKTDPRSDLQSRVYHRRRIYFGVKAERKRGRPPRSESQGWE
ncbi:hypothetical protein ALC60_11073 [Trachymyrmex zeteki]|uniref:Uncharacterized protein n=1 Tax=Mycetomoellerius zeteki TaxID=64791 RepID=A0A151WQ18_9HYME|nr:hypothetical protein ALC60_11073 [Trachymyrmex zeteki]